VLMIEDDGRHSDCTGWPGIQVPCDDKHQTSRHAVCMLFACGPAASVIGLAEVQRGYEVISIKILIKFWFAAKCSPKWTIRDNLP